MTLIEVYEITKFFKLYANKIDRFTEKLHPKSGPRHDKRFALKNVTFKVRKGEAVGIIGLNGAGKSTLLKIIAGVIQPNSGHVKTYGRVHALLELGMGFHPDFSGRQNVFMLGPLMGYTTSEMKGVLDSIHSFSELGDAFDQPYRTYSSGMQMRLAFSLATAIRPDVLIVDEALSVGDSYFQHKSFERIREFKRQGTSLLLVSHDKSAILSICDRAIFLNGTSIEMDDKPEYVLDCYNAALSRTNNNNLTVSKVSGGRKSVASGTGEARIIELLTLDEAGDNKKIFEVGEKMKIHATVKVFKNLESLVFGFSFKDRLGQTIFGTNTALTKQKLKKLIANETISFHVGLTLNVGIGVYSIQTALVSTETHLEDNYEWVDIATLFEVVNNNKDAFVGSNWLPCQVEINHG